MPLLKIRQDKFPEWCEIDEIKILSVSGRKGIPVFSRAFAFFVADGNCTLTFGNKTFYPSAGDSLFFHNSYQDLLIESDSCRVVFIQGKWGEETGSSGFFHIENSSTPNNSGDPVPYSRMTDFDNHFHDFDECWIILDGSGHAVSEGSHYDFKAGDCILTKAGDHHDLTEVYEKIYGLYFETTLKGEKRLGHLWEHTHSNKLKNNL